MNQSFEHVLNFINEGNQITDLDLEPSIKKTKQPTLPELMVKITRIPEKKLKELLSGIQFETNILIINKNINHSPLFFIQFNLFEVGQMEYYVET